MKKFFLMVGLAIILLNLYAQDYQISFAGTGESSTVESVNVQNLTQCTSANLAGGDILHLVAITGINNIDANKNKALNIYPNPMTEYATIEFEAPVGGDVTVEVYDIASKIIIQTQTYLGQGNHRFLINGIGNGIYLVHVTSETYSYSGKFMCKSNSPGTPKITYQAQRSQTEKQSKIENEVIHETKGTKSLVQMQYNTGDILKIAGISGIYQTIFMIVPENSQTITFDFVACTDGDGNNYPVVQIGSQLWMAENLKTTSYNDGTSIPNVTDYTAWSSLTTGGYCNYNNTNNSDTINAYGHLYNWHAVTDVNNIAPTGWHVATDAEWTALTAYLGGANVSGDKLKENCSAYGFPPNSNNETGFTGLPGGSRWGNGTFNDIGYSGAWWSSTAQSTTFAWQWSLDNSIKVSRLYGYKTAGLSVRCIKD